MQNTGMLEANAVICGVQESCISLKTALLAMKLGVDHGQMHWHGVDEQCCEAIPGRGKGWMTNERVGDGPAWV